MKATGIVRRIDDLGRIVIPKEIRRSLKIREGDPLELYTEDNKIIFQPYVTEVYQDIFEKIYRILNKRLTVKILDRDGDSCIGKVFNINPEEWEKHKERCFPIYDRSTSIEPIGFVWVCDGAPNVEQTARIKTVIEVCENFLNEN